MVFAAAGSFLALRLFLHPKTLCAATNLSNFSKSLRYLSLGPATGKMAQIIECVPNFSEGRDQQIIEAISKSIRSVSGVTLLNVDPGKSTNRTVYTFVGTANVVVEAAFIAAKTAFDLIDMTKQSGEHPRLGALDVCPFIPVSNASMNDCVECAQKFSQRLAAELGVPVYLYGYAATADYRRQVPQIRSGEYEGLADKIKKEEWKPDFGPAEFIPRWGATIAGARKFLIAYNINLLSTKEQAHRIALNIREQGRSQGKGGGVGGEGEKGSGGKEGEGAGGKEGAGEKGRGVEGRGGEGAGRLKAVQGIGWWFEEGKIAQVSTNLTDLDVTTLHEVFVEVEKDAKEMNLPLVGSEIVGLVPLKPVLDAAEYFIKKENLFILEEEQKVQLAVHRLGLNTLSAFDYKTRIIEYAVANSKASPLINLTVKEFINEVAARKPAPGGGSVAALVGSMGAALCRMVGLLTYGNKKFEHLDAEMRQLLPTFHQAMHQLLPLVDEDTRAFNSIIEANRLPSTSEEEKTTKTKAIQTATQTAIKVPLQTAKTANSVWFSLLALVQVANITAISDLQVGAKSLETCVFGAVCNVQINLSVLENENEKKQIDEEAKNELKFCEEEFKKVIEAIEIRKKEVLK